MFSLPWVAFVATELIAAGYFLFAKRQFDFLNVAFVGVLFYFQPLTTGHVLQSSQDLTDTIQPTVYFIATAYTLAVVAASIVSRKFVHNSRPATSSRQLSAPLLVLSIGGLVAALIQSRGSVIQLDKTLSMQEIGILFTLFEVGASLACIAAVVERKWWIVAASIFLLFVDLLAGFRLYATLTALSVATILLSQQGPIRLYRKLPSYGLALVVLVAAMLLTHTMRLAVFDQVAKWQGVPAKERVTKTQQMRSDTLQFQTALSAMGSLTLPKWVAIPLNMLQQSEPFMVQATLVGAIQTDMSCKPSNILKSVWLLVPPGLSRFAPTNPYPPTFYDEFQPILYPDITYGTGGNIWAEMLCRFGYPGLAIFGLALIMLLVALDRLRLVAPASFTAPIALVGTVFAFYINRNDLHFTLVMVKQIVYGFAAAYLLSVLSGLSRSFRQERDAIERDEHGASGTEGNRTGSSDV
jgi:hypothetical protein